MPENQPARTPRRWARSNRKGGRHRLGIHGRLHIGTPGRLRRNPQPVEADRLIEAAKLARKYPRARIIYTGGTSKLLGSDVREADYATQILETLGIPGSRIEIEREARNTAENATFGKLMASPKAGDHWLLITSASHMPRAIGLFCAAGFNVEAVPTGWRTTGHLDLFRLDGIADGLVLTGIATREWLGLIASRLFGDTGALLPGPCA
ncbi:YdcF family protein [Bradyrhizobium guangdongense]